MIQVVPLETATRAEPLLRQLRSDLNDATFATRLARAVTQGYRVLGAEDAKGALVGALGYRISDDLCWGRTFYVDDLIVDKTNRGAGIGQALMSAARQIARPSCDHIRLCSGMTRLDAHRFYEAQGLARFSFQFVATP